METSALHYANQADILKSYMRDSQCLEFLQSATLDLLQNFLSPSFIDTHKDWLNTTIAFFYHCMCSVGTGYTIGEEDTGLRVSLPSQTSKRFLMRSLRFVLSYILPIIAPKIIHKYFGESFQKYKVPLSTLSEIAQKYILCRFFFTGKYLSYSDWVLGLRYFVVVKDEVYPNAPFYSYAGKIIAVQLLVIFGKIVWNALKNTIWKTPGMNSKDKDGIDFSTELAKEDEARQCPICMDVRKNPSAAKCGHIFCWDCIVTFVQHKPQCPVCRKETKPQDVICLYNAK